MGPLALLNHAINFVAPAVWLALLMPMMSHMVMKKRVVSHTFRAQVAINFGACLVALALGLVLFGRDGKMLTYLASVFASATSQWLLLKGRRV